MARRNHTTLSEALEISEKGVNQFRSRISEYDSGWLIGEPGTDVGEDLLIRIFEHGEFTGISCYVQHKSTPNLQNYTIKNNNLSFELPVKKLMQWMQSTIPVVIVIWDINLKEGCWVHISKAVENLSERNPNWGMRKSVHIHIPCINLTTDSGLNQLRGELAPLCYPNIAQRHSLSMRLVASFPETFEGREAGAALQRFYDYGDAVTIPDGFVNIEFSEWYERLFGPFTPKSGPISIGLQKPGPSRPSRIDVLTKDGIGASLPYVDLREVKRGHKESTISNEHQPIPLTIRLLLGHEERSVAIELALSAPSANVQDNLMALQFVDALSNATGLIITDLETGKPIRFPAPSESSKHSPSREFIDLVGKLCRIQEKMNCRFSLQEWTLTFEDAETINQIISIIDTGTLSLHAGHISVSASKELLLVALQALEQGQSMQHPVQTPDTSVELLGETIQLGSSDWKVLGVPEIDIDELRNTVVNLAEGVQTPLQLKVIQAEGFFHNHNLGKDGLILSER